MKILLLSLALTCAALGNSETPFASQNNPVKPGLTCTDSQVIVWVAARGQLSVERAAAFPQARLGAIYLDHTQPDRCQDHGIAVTGTPFERPGDCSH